LHRTAWSLAARRNVDDRRLDSLWTDNLGAGNDTDKKAFKNAPAPRGIAWWLTIMLFFVNIVALSAAKFLRYQARIQLADVTSGSIVKIPDSAFSIHGALNALNTGGY